MNREVKSEDWDEGGEQSIFGPKSRYGRGTRLSQTY
jgi:hypothetical protein